MQHTVDQQITASPEAAFDAMADARNEIHWNSQVSRSELTSGEPLGAGSTFTTVNRGQEYLATIAVYERPERLRFDVSGKAMDITATFSFRPADGGTAFTGEFDMRPKGAMKVVLPLMTPVVRRDLAKQSASFARFVTGR